MAQVLRTRGVHYRGSVTPLTLEAPLQEMWRQPKAIMEKTAEQVYTDLLRQLANPSAAQPVVVADMFREVERMHSAGQVTDWQLENAREAYARTVSATGSRIGGATGRAISKARVTLQSAAGQVRQRATTAIATYTKEDPTRAILIAAGTGAFLMLLVSITVRSGVRTVKRKVQR